MKFRLLSLIAFGLALLAPQAHADIQWQHDYNWAVSQSRSSGKPLFIDFYTDWCGWCKKLDVDVFPNSQIQQMAGNFVMLKLNAEGNGQAAAEAFQVQGFPTLLFLAPDGHVLNRYDGYLEKGDLLSAMNNSLRRATKGSAAPSLNSPQTAITADVPAGPNLKRLSFSPLPSNWKRRPGESRITGSQDSGGVLLLDENGATDLSTPAPKPVVAARKPVKNSKPVAKSKSKHARH